MTESKEKLLKTGGEQKTLTSLQSTTVAKKDKKEVEKKGGGNGIWRSVKNCEKIQNGGEQE